MYGSTSKQRRKSRAESSDGADGNVSGSGSDLVHWEASTMDDNNDKQSDHHLPSRSLGQSRRPAGREELALGAADEGSGVDDEVLRERVDPTVDGLDLEPAIHDERDEEAEDEDDELVEVEEASHEGRAKEPDELPCRVGVEAEAREVDDAARGKRGGTVESNGMTVLWGPPTGERERGASSLMQQDAIVSDQSKCGRYCVGGEGPCG